MSQRARISLSGTDPKKVDSVCNQIRNISEKTGVQIRGPVPLPTERGVMEDLHLALASNDVTQGWTPTHHIMMYHSKADTTVPYDNAERAVAKLGKWAVLFTANYNQDHVKAGEDFFAGTAEGKVSLVLQGDLRVAVAIEKLIKISYTGQKAGDIASW